MRYRAGMLAGALILAVTCVANAQSSRVPTNGTVLTTPAPASTLNPDFAVNPPAGQIDLGRHLFNVHCATCHGFGLEGTSQGPPLRKEDAAYVDFMLRTGRMPALVPWEQEFDKPPMFSIEQQRAIVAYVMTKSTGNKALPQVTLGGNLKHGRAVFAENCQQCHAATGHGNSVGFADVAPSLMNASPELIAEAVREGPDVMPRFGPKVIDDTNLDDVITYIEWMQHAKYNPGGLQLANWGPVSEGFVTWFFGIGILVLLARRIGNTS